MYRYRPGEFEWKLCESSYDLFSDLPGLNVELVFDVCPFQWIDNNFRQITRAFYQNLIFRYRCNQAYLPIKEKAFT